MNITNKEAINIHSGYTIPHYPIWKRTTLWEIESVIVPHFYNKYITWWYVIVKNNIEYTESHEKIILL